MSDKKPQNLFTTSHVLSVLGMLYILAISPAIDKWSNDQLSKKDVINLFNGFVFALVTGGLKLKDDNVYTHKFLPGKNKEDIISSLTTNIVQEQVVNPITNKIQDQILNPINNVINEVSINPLDPVTNTVNNTINNPFNLLSNPPTNLSNTILSPLYVKANQDTWYKTSPVDSNTLDSSNKIRVQQGTNTNINDYLFDNDNNHCKITINNNKVLYAYTPHIFIIKDGIEVNSTLTPTVNPNSFIPTIEQCNELYNTNLRQEEYKDLLNCLARFNISTKKDVAHFLAQVGHESASLRYNKELASGDDYEYRDDLGNTQPGDGRRYKGAGFIQLTGRANYQAFSDYIKDPKVMEGVDYVASIYPFASAGFWWWDNKMSEYINNEGADIYQVSTAVNGANPANGIEDRIYYYNKACNLLGI